MAMDCFFTLPVQVFTGGQRRKPPEEGKKGQQNRPMVDG